MLITYRPASPGDFDKIVRFVDQELNRDAFVPRGQQKEYLKYKVTLLAMVGQNVVGWAVMSKNKTLIHLLVGKGYRGLGIGSAMLKLLAPRLVRSKKDQSTGDPIDFYMKRGYSPVLTLQGRLHNIDVLEKIEGIPPKPTTTETTMMQQNDTDKQPTPQQPEGTP